MLQSVANYASKTTRLSGLGANLNAQVVTTLIQLLSVPTYLHFWSVARYGEWLLYSAIPSYLSLADIGITVTATNLVMAYIARGRRNLAIRQLHSAIKYCTIIYVVTVFIILSLLIVGKLTGLFTRRDVIVIASLSLCVILNLFSATIDISYRASGRLALGINIITVGRLLEWLGGFAGLLTWSSFEAVAMGMCVSRILFVSAHFVHSRYTIICPRIGIRYSSFELIRKTKVASLGFFFMPIVYAIQIQGVVLIIGSLISAEAVGAFSATRTYTRVSSQISAVICRTLWPKFTVLSATNDYLSLRKLAKIAIRSILLISIFVLSLQYFLRSFVGRYWAVGKLDVDAPLLCFLLISCLFGNLAQVPSTALLATSQHISYTAWLAVATCFGACAYVASFSYFGVEAIGPAVAVVEFMLFLVALISFSVTVRRHPNA